MKMSVIIATCTLFFCGFSVARSAGNTIATIPHNQASQEALASSRLAALQQELKTGNRAALENFWQEVTKQGTPLVEPIKGESRYVWLTFLWRAKEETKNVVIGSDLGNWRDLSTLQMTRLADTDLWYKTYRVRDDARFPYRLSVNDSLIPFYSEAREKQPTKFQPDPLNPRQYDFFKPTIYSVVELPAAPSLALITRPPDVPKSQGGRIDRFHSTILNNDHRVWVYTPPGYKREGKPYNLLLLFDGSGYVSLIPAPVVLDNLLAKGLIPPTVAVLVDSGSGEARDRELTCNPQFVEFVTKEVLPWVRQNYNVTSEPSRTIVGGASFGGLAAAYVAMKHPEIFGNVLAQSGSFWWKPENDDEYEWLTRQFVASPKLPIRFYLQIGLLENLSTARLGSPTMLVASRHLRDVLQAKGYTVQLQEINGGHDFFNWQAALPDGLTALLKTKEGEMKR
jgi:enterochelin esterase-like enzyme